MAVNKIENNPKPKKIADNNFSCKQNVLERVCKNLKEPVCLQHFLVVITRLRLI